MLKSICEGEDEAISDRRRVGEGSAKGLTHHADDRPGDEDATWAK